MADAIELFEQSRSRLRMLLGVAESENVLARCLAAVGAGGVRTMPDLAAVGAKLCEEGGIVEVVGRSLKAAANAARLDQNDRLLKMPLTLRTSLDHVVQRVCDVAQKAGFDARATSEIGRAVAAVAQNALNHGIRNGAEGGVNARRFGNGVRIEVWDTGPGISPDIIAAFNHRPTAPDVPPSSGLGGLATARHLMDVMKIISMPKSTQIFMERHLK